MKILRFENSVMLLKIGTLKIISTSDCGQIDDFLGENNFIW